MRVIGEGITSCAIAWPGPEWIVGYHRVFVGDYRVCAGLQGAWQAEIALSSHGPKGPSRPEEFHLEPLTDPDVNLSIYPARATQ